MGNTQKSVYFGNYKSAQEQWLLDSLVTESINIFGESMYYLPRRLVNYDQVYGADDQSVYDRAISVPIYIENVKGFGGDGTMYAKFGLEIRDRMLFSISQTVFAQEVGTITNQVRPGESDLIYFPLNDKCFQIKYVEKFEMFYALGALYTWKMDCELFEYSGERMQTGIPSIDMLQVEFSMVGSDWGIRAEGGDFIMSEDNNYIDIEGTASMEFVKGDDSAEIQKESQAFIDFSITDPFSEGQIGSPIGT